MGVLAISGAGLYGVGADPSILGAEGLSFFPSDFDAIATVAVGAAGAAIIQFTSIPTTYKHLQIRWVGQTNRGTYATDNLLVRINNDSSVSYSSHELRGDGASAASFASVSQTRQYVSGVIGTTQQANSFGAGVIDILDYTSTSKNKTLNFFAGKDNNGTYAGVGGYVQVASGLYYATPAAVSSVQLLGENANWQQFSTATLYGIRG
jgi:hypothetical protein